MRKPVRQKYLSAAIGLMCSMALPAQADELSDLKAQMNKLMQKIESLEARQNTTAEKQAATDAKLAAAPAPTSSRPGTFQIPGTETTVKLGGFVQLEASKELDGTFGGQTYSAFVPFSVGTGGIPYDDTVQARREDGQMQWEARNTRLNLDINSPTSYGNLRIFLETDLFGTGGTKFQSNSNSFRLRHAFAELGPWLVGQTWTNSGDIAQGVTLFDVLGGPVGIPAIGRFPQIRYTHAFDQKSKFSVSLEQPVQDWAGADVVTFGATGTTVSKDSIDKWPDLTARFGYADTWGRQSVGAVVRHLEVEGSRATPLTSAGSPELRSSSTIGYAVNYQGQINLFGTNKLLYSLVYEDGAGRYINHPQTSAFLDDDGKLDTVRGHGWSLGYQHFWAPAWQSNIAYGQNRFKASDWTKVSSNRYGRYKEADGLHLNLMWSPIKGSLIGVEYVYGRIENDLGDEGSAQRIMFGSRFSF